MEPLNTSFYSLHKSLGHCGGLSMIPCPGEFKTLNEAIDEAGRLHDAGDDDDFVVVSHPKYGLWHVNGYQLHKSPCPVCGKDVRSMDFRQTQDCHGIPMRYVCEDCYSQIMDTRGYDGEEYSELDENIYEDW